MNDIYQLKNLKRHIPFLNQIPDKILNNLDLGEFIAPNKQLNILRKKLELKLNHHVMTYKTNQLKLSIKSLHRYLCSHIQPAKLNDHQLIILKEYENQAFRYGASFCVYKKPVELIKIQNSWLFGYLNKK